MGDCARVLEREGYCLLMGGGAGDAPLCLLGSHAWLTVNGPACAVVSEPELGCLGQGFPVDLVQVWHGSPTFRRWLLPTSRSRCFSAPSLRRLARFARRREALPAHRLTVISFLPRGGSSPQGSGFWWAQLSPLCLLLRLWAHLYHCLTLDLLCLEEVFPLP